MGDVFKHWYQSIENNHDVTASHMALLLGTAAVFGAAVGIIHWFFRYREGSRPFGHGTTLIMLCIIVALVTYVIGDNIARAFGLVGALGIVRFRTSVSDTRDTCFVILAVAVGMALGAGYLVAAAVTIPVVAVVCFLLWVVEKTAPSPARGGRLKLKVDKPADAEAAVKDMSKWLRSSRIMTCSNAKKESNTDFTYAVHLVPGTDPSALVEALSAKPGIHKVSWSAR